MQAEKPLIHQLFTRSTVLVKELVNLVVKEGSLPGNSVDLADMKIDDSVYIYVPPPPHKKKFEIQNLNRVQ